MEQEYTSCVKISPTQSPCKWRDRISEVSETASSHQFDGMAIILTSSLRGFLWSKA